jgi:hypothetical protein
MISDPISKIIDKRDSVHGALSTRKRNFHRHRLSSSALKSAASVIVAALPQVQGNGWKSNSYGIFGGLFN